LVGDVPIDETVETYLARVNRLTVSPTGEPEIGPPVADGWLGFLRSYTNAAARAGAEASVHDASFELGMLQRRALLRTP
jgi:hypothetical protein